MGYSQSTAFLIVFIGIIISLSIFVPSVESSVNEVIDGAQDTNDIRVEVANTDANVTTEYTVTNISGGPDEKELSVYVDNNGPRTILIRDITILIDGEYVNWDSFQINSNTDRSFITSGEVGEFTFDYTGEPDPTHVKLVLKRGEEFIDVV